MLGNQFKVARNDLGKKASCVVQNLSPVSELFMKSPHNREIAVSVYCKDDL